MCGIVGIYAPKGQLGLHEYWQDMVNHLYHRGPDDGAWWADGPFFLGHRRLSIIDLNTGSQPMATSDGRLVVTYNGEIYNYIELRRELAGLGHHFQTSSDTEVLLHGYSQWGTGLPEHLTGQFAFAIADRKERSLFLARDRFGEKPLFIMDQGGQFAFASEMRPLAVLPFCSRRVDPSALGAYLCLNYVPGDRSMMQGIRRLPIASWLYLGPDGQKKQRVYWRPLQESEPENTHVPQDQALEQFQEYLDQASRICLRSDVDVGIFLSGGIDSSLVAEAASRHGRLSTAYFLDFAEATYSEYDAAKQVADLLGIPLRKTTLGPQALDDFERIVSHADDPLADSSALAVWTISAMASQGNKVVLSGDGGDELFGGYLTYRATHIHERISQVAPGFLRRAASKMAYWLPTSEAKVSFTYKLMRFARAMDLHPAVAHLTWNGTWLPRQAASFIAPGHQMLPKVEQSLASLKVSVPDDGIPNLTHLQLHDMAEYLPNDILVKADRMSMAFGLEVRTPFLNHNLAQWAIRLPERLKIAKSGQLKYLLRSAARRTFGPSIADRKKQGFSIPIHHWTRGHFRDKLTDLLSLDSVARLDMLNPKRVQKALEMHLSGKASLGWELWGLAVLMSWHRQRVESPPAKPAAHPLKQCVFPKQVL